MTPRRPETGLESRVLASDLDGTLIPLPGRPSHEVSLRRIETELHRHQRTLVFATGRRFESVMDAIERHRLPPADWIVSDVGTSIHRGARDDHELMDDYERHMRELTLGMERRQLERRIRAWRDLVPQAAEHQRPFKSSYCLEPHLVEPLTAEINATLEAESIPWRALGLVDPFDGSGLMDLLPARVSKAYALHWLTGHAGYHWEEVVYAGDSGNDLAALVSGFRAVVMRNAPPGLAGQVRAHLDAHGLSDRLYHSRGEATDGVLEGCRHFGLFPSEASTPSR